MSENTQDWSKFGYREIEEAKELLSHIREINSQGKVSVEFNPNSGNVFLVDEDYNVWMMTSENKIEKWFNCPYCGYEGFKDDLLKEHNIRHKDCKEFQKELKNAEVI